jgi:hypothetical protein
VKSEKNATKKWEGIFNQRVRKTFHNPSKNAVNRALWFCVKEAQIINFGSGG